MWELVVIWYGTQDKDVYEFETEHDAYKAGENMRQALGNQIQWCCVRRKAGEFV